MYPAWTIMSRIWGHKKSRVETNVPARLVIYLIAVKGYAFSA